MSTTILRWLPRNRWTDFKREIPSALKPRAFKSEDFFVIHHSIKDTNNLDFSFLFDWAIENNVIFHDELAERFV
ncbi:MAG: hypothetical protein LUE86_08390, partial [Clostridiales bacterium]|nr:hypothetical protein [Clostridiales bacterium]